MTEYQVCIFEALMILVNDDGDLIESQTKEECINHKLAQYVEFRLYKRNLLGNCSVDIEYNKYRADEKKNSYGRPIRPDIIAHERKSGNINNLIVIEAKKGYGTPWDKGKVTDLVANVKYSYSVGAVISYLPGQKHVKIKFFKQDETWENYQLNKENFLITKTPR